MGSRLVIVVVIGAVITGCGSNTPRQKPLESPITVSRVEKVFRVAPLHLNGVVALRNLLLPLPYGDLGEYSFGAAKSFKALDTGPLKMIPASLTVFPTVAGAQRASLLILKGGECVPHIDKRYFAAWSKCDHLRVANVLLIMSSGIDASSRNTLVAALRQLGTPTRS